MFESLQAALAEVAAVDPAALATRDAMIQLQRCTATLQALHASAAVAYDECRDWAVDGAHTSPAWVAARTRVPKATAARRLRLGRALAHMPAAAAAWQAGDLDEAHVALLAAARNHRTADAFARDEAQLVDAAKTKRFTTFQRHLHYWEHHEDPDGTDDAAEARRNRRGATLSQSLDGDWFGNQHFDPISGTIVHDELSRLEKLLFEADWKEAAARLGRDPKLHELNRTATQRRADAYVEMATRSRSTPEGSRRPQPLFTVIIDYDTFARRLCELANRTVVTPGSLVPYLDQSLIERIVFDGPSRVIDVGHARCYTGARRRAVQVRDLECYHPTCDTPADRCQIDHIHPAAQGGPTALTNGRLACGFHNRLRNHQPDPDPPDEWVEPDHGCG